MICFSADWRRQSENLKKKLANRFSSSKNSSTSAGERQDDYNQLGAIICASLAIYNLISSAHS